jgi:hypothetical protein
MHFRQLPTAAKPDYCVFRQAKLMSEFVGEALPQMKNPFEVLRIKEQELMRVRKEMEALRLAARLLDAEDPGAANGKGQPKLPRVVEMP